MEEKASGFQQIITGDESWFFLDYPRHSLGAASCHEFLQHIKQKTDMEKCLVSMLLSVSGVHSCCDVQKGTMYSSALFTDAVMPGLIEDIRSRTLRKISEGWLIHMNNVCPNSSGRAQRYIEASRTKRVPHPGHSPDRSRVMSSSLDLPKEN
jgi:hypothetical protein